MYWLNCGLGLAKIRRPQCFSASRERGSGRGINDLRCRFAGPAGKVFQQPRRRRPGGRPGARCTPPRPPLLL